jgi:uncharacterized membrane protein
VAEKFRDDFRRFFLRGLTAVLPVIVTVFLLVSVFALVQNYFGKYINVAAQWVVVQFLTISKGTPTTWIGPQVIWDATKKNWEQYHLGWIGFVLAIVAIYVVGRFVASILGRGLYSLIEQTFFRTPVVKQVYPYVKQVVDFLLSEKKLEFSRVVAVEYPRKGVWSLGLVTGPGMRTLHKNIGSDLLTIFIPSSPTPVTGYTITVHRGDVIDVPISIDDALRFTVSGGVVTPVSQQLSQAEIDQARQAVLPAPENKADKEISE